jgi:hypothetical protein
MRKVRNYRLTKHIIMTHMNIFYNLKIEFMNLTENTLFSPILNS